MNKRKIYFISGIVLYAIVGLLTIYTIWAFSHSADVISEAISGGQINTGENMYDIISFYMGNCAQYFIFALLLAAAGLILQKELSPTKPSIVSELPNESKSNDDELDELFDYSENNDQKHKNVVSYDNEEIIK